jgi:hypothetical protein
MASQSPIVVPSSDKRRGLSKLKTLKMDEITSRSLLLPDFKSSLSFVFFLLEAATLNRIRKRL